MHLCVLSLPAELYAYYPRVTPDLQLFHTSLSPAVETGLESCVCYVS